MESGYIYLLGNMSMPDLYKIGRTKNHPSARAHELSTASGVPYPFDVLHWALFMDYQRVERWMHDAMHEHRYNNSREFFSADSPWFFLHYFELAKTRFLCLGESEDAEQVA